MADEYKPIFDQKTARQLVIAANEDNDMANTEFAEDIKSAPYGYIADKYGKDVADNRRLYTEERVKVDAVEEADRSFGQVVGDTAIAAGAGFVGTVSSVVGAGIAGIGAVDKYFDEENDAIANYAVDYTQSGKEITDWMRSFQSKELQERRGLSGEQAQLDAEDNLTQYDEDTEGREPTILDDFAWIGRGTMNNLGRIASDPAVAGDVIAEGLGSLGPSAKLASVASKAVTKTSSYQAAKIAHAIAPTQGTAFIAKGADWVHRGAIAASVGSTEAAGVYSQTVNEVLGMEHGDLIDKSSEYSRMIDEGVDPDDAKTTLAANAGMDAFVKAFPYATTLGIVAGKFEAAPLTSFRGSGFIGGLRQVGAQTLEEGGQGFTGQVATNLAIRDEGVDPLRSPTEGAGEALATGMIAGTGMAGVSSGPAAVSSAAKSTAKVVKDVAASDAVSKIASAAGNVAATGLDIAEGAGKAVAATKAGVATIKGTKAAAAKTAEVVTPVVDAANEKVKDFNTRPDRKAQTANLESLNQVEELSKIELKSPIDPEQSDEILNAELGRKTAVKQISSTAATGSVPSTFQSTTPENASTLGRVTGVLTKLTEKGVRIKKLSDGDVLYAAQEMQTLQNAIPDLPENIQAEVKKVMASQEFTQIQQRVTRIDLNKTQTEDTVITDDVVQETKAVALSNPVNSNPVVIEKVLNQEDRTDISARDIKFMKVAKRIGDSITQRVASEIDIAKYKNVSLSVKPEYAKGGKNLLPVPKAEAVTRDITVGSSTDRLSISGFSSQIIQGLQTEDNSTIVDGVKVDVVKQTIPRFHNFAQHMINKVIAANDSFDKKDANGVGPLVTFESLSPTGRMVKPGEPGNAKGVYYSTKSPKSVSVIQAIHADAVATVEVYNAFAEAFPEQFPQGPVEVPTLRGFEPETTTAVEEEVSPESETSNETQVSDNPPTLEEMMYRETRTKDDFSKMSEDDLIESANRWTEGEDGIKLQKMSQERQNVVLNYTNAVVEYFNLPTDLVTGITWLRTPDEGHMGQAMWGERLIGVRASVIKTLLGSTESDDFLTAEHVVFHELMHLIDAYSSDDVTRPSSHGSDLFSTDPQNLGVIYQEVVAATEADPDLKEDMKYILSFDKVDTQTDFASEMIADIGAMYFADRENTQKLFPEGVKYVEELIEKAGGTVIQETSEVSDGDTTQESSEADVPSQEPETVSLDERSFENLNPRFNQSFTARDIELPYSNGSDLLSMVSEVSENSDYIEFVKEHHQNLMDKANERLATVKTNKSDDQSIKYRILDGQDSAEYRRNKNTLMVDQTTGEYDPDLLSIASVAVLDWVTGVRASNPKSLSEVLDDMGLTYDMLSGSKEAKATSTQQVIKDITYGVLPRDVSEGLAKDIVRMWGMRINRDAPMVDARGAAEGMIKELLEAFLELDTGLIIETKVPYFDTESGNLVSQSVFNVFPMIEKQEDIGLTGQEAVKKMLTPELNTMPTIGTSPEIVDNTQSRGDVKLSTREKRALRRMQNQGHTLAETLNTVVEGIGYDELSVFLGKSDFSLLTDRHPLRASIAGKNLSIERDYAEAMSVVNAIKDGANEDGSLPQAFYRVGVSRVGRHQFKGINPQNNKILRALVTPTISNLDMTNQKHVDAFWLTVAQAADISGFNKVENQNHKYLLDNIQQVFDAKYGEAVDIILDHLNGGELDGKALVKAMGGSGEMQQLSAVFAVAQLDKATAEGTQAEFTTSLSFELDGKTDGPGNMMANFGQGILTEQDFMNFKRVGLFLGSKAMTLNKFFGQGTERDLYEVTALKGQNALYEAISQSPDVDKARLHAVARFASAFGDLEIDLNTGGYVMTRNASKNPMTKTVYGSSERGIGTGLAQEMTMEMYRELIANPDGLKKYPGGQEAFKQDYELVFGGSLPTNVDWNKTFIKDTNMDSFTDLVTDTLGKILSDTAKQVIGDPITEVNDSLVLMTAFQTEYLTAKFKELLEAKVQERADKNDGKVDRSSLTQRDYDDVVAEIREYSPTYANGMQTLDIGSLSPSDSGIKLSESMTGGFQMAASMISPELAGVKAIPYITQGRGDAMMMNWIYGGEEFSPEGTLPVFDGIDMPIEKIFEYAQPINEAVLKNWEADVIGDIVNDVEGFLKKTANDSELLKSAWKRAFENAKKKNTTAQATTPEGLIADLYEMQRLNQARKVVFKKIGISVDHMGGSSTAFTQGPDGREWSLGEINDLIRQELNLVSEPDIQVNSDGSIEGETTEINTDTLQIEEQREPEEGKFSKLVVTNAATMMDSLVRETRNKPVAAAVRILQKKTLNTRIVIGSPQEVSDWYTENVGASDTPLNQDKKGTYFPNSDVILITDNNHETIVHELIHAATFQTLENHYDGSDTSNSDTVARLEKLSEEFMDAEIDSDAARSAKAQIISLQAKTDAFSKAAALNEMMAWTLSNESLTEELGARKSSVIQRMSKVVKALMQRLLGGIKSDIMSNIQFNTELLVTEQGKDTPLETENTDNELTPVVQKFTNFWIDLVNQRLEDAKNAKGQVSSKLAQIHDYRKNASKAVDTLTFGGFVMSGYQQETFKAIHMVLAMEMRLNAQSASALNDMFKQVTDNLSPEMMGDIYNQERYSAIMEVLGGTKNDEGISDAIAVLLALSQTNSVFRDAIDQLPAVENEEGSPESLNDFLGSMTGMLMNKAVGTIDLNGQSASQTLDQLSESILKDTSEKEYRILAGLMANIDKADAYLEGAFKKLAGYTESVNQELRDSNRSKLTKYTFSAVTAATAFLDQDRAEIQAQGLKRVTHMGHALDSLVFAREFVTEVIGTDADNAAVTSMLDEATYAASSVRQNYREDLPIILQDAFTNHPDAAQWKATHKTMGRTDFTVLFDQTNPNSSFKMFQDENVIDKRIVEAEAVIRSNFSTSTANVIMEKGQQLADFMNGKGGGHQLWSNSYAINKMAGDFKDTMTGDIDRLVSLYALKGSDGAMRQQVFEMYEKDQEAMVNLAVYMKALNKEEDTKVVSEMAKMNGYKGYIPDVGKAGTKVIIAEDYRKEDLEKKGYKRVADATSDDSFSVIKRGYYVTSTKQTGTYSQGVMQLIQNTYRGVDATTGLTVNGSTSGLITGVAVETVTDAMNNATNGVKNNKETLKPVFDEEGVVYYERLLNPDVVEKYTDPKANLAMMMGQWAGRQVEEKFGQQYNNALIDELKSTYDNREDGDDGLYVNLAQAAKDLKAWNKATTAERRKMKKPDSVHVESWNVISPQTKRYIEEVFGENAFYVRKDQVNIALGYRDPSVVDLWTGNTRVPEALQEGVQAITSMFMGKKAMKVMVGTEGLVQGAVSYTKNLIVVRSLVVPYMNTQANVVQLSTRGIPVKQQYKGYRAKLAEIEKFNENRKKLMQFDTRIQLAGVDQNKVSILRKQRQVIYDENARMSVAPLIAAGAYKNISEGITEMDAEFSSGRLGEWIENQVDKLPNVVGTPVKYGILSKDTAIYKGANKAVQYGDFIAKSIYYDHLIDGGKTHDEAMKLVNEEFVNFSVLPGRTRQYLEGLGATWFLTFKIRIMKIAMNQLRQNPARSLILGATIAEYGSPQADNLASVIVDERIGYSLGWEMLYGSFGLNPWYNLYE